MYLIRQLLSTVLSSPPDFDARWMAKSLYRLQ
jgi:hypothetical protein